MEHTIPKLLIDSIANGSWKSVAPEVLRRCLGYDLDDLQLYSNTNIMVRVSENLDDAGYVDDPEFCMTREVSPAPEDPRLVYQRAIFIGGSVVPGDDVFIAIEQRNSKDSDPFILVLDWRKEIPQRWSKRGRLSELISGIIKEDEVAQP